MGNFIEQQALDFANVSLIQRDVVASVHLEDWEDVLRILICDWSKNSYLKVEGVKNKEDYRYQFNAQAASLSRRIYKEYGVDLKTLGILRNIYLLTIDSRKVISKISPEQKELLDRLGLGLEV